MNNVLKSVLGYSLAAALVIAPTAAFAKGHNAHAHHGKAFGHLVAPGWLRLHGLTATMTATTSLPFGIRHKLDMEEGNESTSTEQGEHAHMTMPPISSVQVSGIGSTTANVSWMTSQPATSKVFFAPGTSLNLGTAATVSSGTLVRNHLVNLTGLTSSTTYSFAAQSANAKGNVSTSATGSFTTGL